MFGIAAILVLIALILHSCKEEIKRIADAMEEANRLKKENKSMADQSSEQNETKE